MGAASPSSKRVQVQAVDRLHPRNSRFAQLYLKHTCSAGARGCTATQAVCNSCPRTAWHVHPLGGDQLPLQPPPPPLRCRLWGCNGFDLPRHAHCQRLAEPQARRCVGSLECLGGQQGWRMQGSPGVLKQGDLQRCRWHHQLLRAQERPVHGTAHQRCRVHLRALCDSNAPTAASQRRLHTMPAAHELRDVGVKQLGLGLGWRHSWPPKRLSTERACAEAVHLRA